jgi:phenylacetaldehyde dehydrogenase
VLLRGFTPLRAGTEVRPVVDGVTQFAKNIRLGPGLDTRTQMGPLVSQTQLERVSGFLRSGEQQGAKALCGGKRRGDSGYFVEPTVLVDTSPEMKVYQEEIFGPVVTVIPLKNADDDLVARANDTTYGLAAGIFTRDMARAHASQIACARSFT